jgi:uncharacterized protein involved in outer membrane biogenesis
MSTAPKVPVLRQIRVLQPGPHLLLVRPSRKEFDAYRAELSARRAVRAIRAAYGCIWRAPAQNRTALEFEEQWRPLRRIRVMAKERRRRFGARLLKIVGSIVGGLLLLGILTGVAIWLGGAKAAVWAIEYPLSSMIGRQVTIGGPLTIEWGAPTKIIAEDVHVANAAWSQEKEMFTAHRLEIDIFARTLLRGPVRIPTIDLAGAKLLLETSDHGDRNWDFGLSAAAPQKREQSPDLEHLHVADGSFVFRNGETKAETVLDIAKLQVDAPDPTAAVAIAGDGTFQQKPVAIAAMVGPLAALRDTSKPYPVKLDGTLDQIRITTDGTIAEPLDFAGLDLRLSLSGKKLDELAALLGVPLPELPDFRCTSQLTGGNGKWALKALTVKLGKSDLEGGLAIDTNAKVPYIEANLTSSYIDLVDFKGFYGGKPDRSSAPTPQKAPDPSGRVLPETPIDVSKLPDLNADLKFDAARIKSAAGLPIERISLDLQLKDGTLTIKPLRFHTARGDVDLNLHFNPFTRNAPPHLQGSIDVRHIDLHELLGGPTMPDIVKRTEGTVGGFIKLDTNGVSLREFLARMNGDARFFMENGQVSDLLQKLAPLNVLGALGVYVSGDKPVPINCLVSRFDIKNGVAMVSTLLLDTSSTEVVGAGEVNFADETITLTLTPRNKSFTVVSLHTPVDVGGTFGDPQYHLKPGGLVARLGAAVGLGIVFPPAALLALVDTGLGEHNACSVAYAAQQPPDIHALGAQRPARKQRQR